MRPLRVAYLSAEGFASKGGIGRVGAYLHAAFEGAGEVRLVDVRTRLTDLPVLKHLTMPLALLLFALRCMAGRYDIVHVNIARKGSTWRKLAFAGAARRLGVPVALHLHGSGYDGYFADLPHGLRERVRRGFLRADRVVALSDYWARFLVEDMGVPRERLCVIPNGVPTLPPVVRSAPAGSPVRILFLGLLGSRKGSDVLIDALAALPAGLPEWRATLAGNGDVKGMAAQAARHGLASRIDTPGWIDSAGARALLAQADLFVLPSRAENQPVAILEAMMAGVPVVGSDVGAIPMQVADGETGIIVPAGEVAPLAAALARLLGDAALRAAMGAAGRERALRLFSIESCAAAFTALYRGMARRP